MFTHNTDHEFTGLIDLRPFWRNEDKYDQFRISVQADSIEQVLFTKTNSRFNRPGGREVLFSVGLPSAKINFLMPVKYDRNFGWDEPAYKLETHPANIWEHPAYTRSECDLVFKTNNSYWKIFSVGFPDTQKRWELPMFKILTTEGDFRLSIYHSKEKTFCTADQLKDLCWTVSSYSQPLF